MRFNHEFQLTKREKAFCLFQADGVTMRLDFFEHMLRVALLHPETPLVPTWSVSPKGEVPLGGRDKLSTEGLASVETAVSEDENAFFFTLDGLRFTVEKKNFRITAEGERGVLYRDRSGLAYNFSGELGAGSAHYTDRFDGQQVFGLGDKGGPVNKANRRYALGATDSMGYHAEYSDPLYKEVPFFFVRHDGGSYGLYYDTYSMGKVDFGVEHDNYFEPFQSIHFDEENLVFYLILGSPKQIISRFSALLGEKAPVPEWAFRYTGSTMEYTDAKDADHELRGFLEKCRETGIRPGGFWLSSGYTEYQGQRCVFHWNTEKVPSPEDLASTFAKNGVHLIPNVKPAFLTIHPLYDEIAANGWFLHFADGTPAKFPFWGGMASYLDFTNPGACEFWKRELRAALIDRGYEHPWNDNNEYDVEDPAVLADGFGHPIPANRIRPLFSYLMARASREAALEAGVPELFNVSRAGIAGMERVATTWTGDNFTSFPELRWNHRQLMTMALSGYLFFGPDIGGFAGPKPSEELFFRWLQYGLFLPRFTLHSWKPGEPSTMPWLYPERIAEVRRLFDLREALVPTIFAEAEHARQDDMLFLSPVFLEDPSFDPESDCFLVGKRFFVAPVLDEGATEVRVTLPHLGAGWKLRGEGETLSPGETLTVPCLPTDLPVWFVRED